MSVHVAILAGGRGERFWPLSRAARPKQVLNLVGDRSLLAETVERALAGASADHVWIVSSAEQRLALQSLSLPIPADRFLWEPVARNTAPAIGAAAALVHASAAARGAVSGPSSAAHGASSAAHGASSATHGASSAAHGASSAAHGVSSEAHGASSAVPGASSAVHGDDALLLVLPADHWIPDIYAFWSSVERGGEVALSRDAIVTFGIPVSRPETGYGYIERGKPLAERVFEVDRFHEKPTVTVAREYQAAGRFYWNAGIFLARPRVLLKEIAQHIPEMASPLETLQAMLQDEAPRLSRRERSAAAGSAEHGSAEHGSAERGSAEHGSAEHGSAEHGSAEHGSAERGSAGSGSAEHGSAERGLAGSGSVEHGIAEGWRRYFEECPSIAIDYGVLERSSNVAVVEAEFTWSDVGGWESWAELRDADSDGNRVSGDLIAQDAHDNIVLADPKHLVALLGVSNLIVIQSGDALLICPRDRAQEVRDLVKRGRADERWKDHF